MHFQIISDVYSVSSAKKFRMQTKIPFSFLFYTRAVAHLHMQECLFTIADHLNALKIVEQGVVTVFKHPKNHAQGQFRPGLRHVFDEIYKIRVLFSEKFVF